MLRLLLTLALSLTLACSESSTPTDGGPTADSGPAPDSGSTPDSGSAPDLGGDCDDECLCGATTGTWDEGSCGHYSCGMPPLCDAIIPGCNCGAGRTFVAGTGCASDDGCTCDDECLCASTGGTWDDGACGHYVCGVPNDCRALIPGCDCGASETFADGVGCAVDPDC